MKKTTKTAVAKHPALLQDLPERLAELETELTRHEKRAPGERPLKKLVNVGPATVEGQKVMQFVSNGKKYAAGHDDVTYSGSNHARGVRHIRFYADGARVLEIEGDFEDQQFGSNFRFQSISLYTAGEWEKAFVEITDGLREYAAQRRAAFKKKRDAQPKTHNFFLD